MRVQSADRQFRIELDYDSDSQAWFVAETELPGLVLEDADPGRLVSRLVDAAAELHELNRNDFPTSVLSIERLSLIPVFKSAIGLPLPSD